MSLLFLLIINSQVNMKVVISLQGKQHLVAAGDTISVDRLSLDPGKPVDVQVLAVVDGKKSKIGTPFVDKAKITANLVTHERGEKLRVMKYHNKINYHVVRGHRQDLSTVKIEKITV
jgi:large subunit ribosomal protein L21